MSRQFPVNLDRCPELQQFNADQLIVLPDTHGNALLTLNILIYHGVLKVCEADYNIIRDIYYKKGERVEGIGYVIFNREDYDTFDRIIRPAIDDYKLNKYSRPKVASIGDFVGDRGNNDYFQMALAECFEFFLIGNHDLEFWTQLKVGEEAMSVTDGERPLSVLARTTQIENEYKFAESTLVMREGIRQQSLELDKVTLACDQLFKRSSVIEYHFDPRGKPQHLIFTHAPLSIGALEAMCKKAGLEFNREALAAELNQGEPSSLLLEYVNRINTCVKQHLRQGTLVSETGENAFFSAESANMFFSNKNVPNDTAGAIWARRINQGDNLASLSANIANTHGHVGNHTIHQFPEYKNIDGAVVGKSNQHKLGAFIVGTHDMPGTKSSFASPKRTADANQEGIDEAIRKQWYDGFASDNQKKNHTELAPPPVNSAHENEDHSAHEPSDKKGVGVLLTNEYQPGDLIYGLHEAKHDAISSALSLDPESTTQVVGIDMYNNFYRNIVDQARSPVVNKDSSINVQAMHLRLGGKSCMTRFHQESVEFDYFCRIVSPKYELICSKGTAQYTSRKYITQTDRSFFKANNNASTPGAKYIPQTSDLSDYVKKRCKYGVLRRLMLGNKIHFMLDGIDFKQVFDQSIKGGGYTGAELRFIYRNWHNITQTFGSNSIQFYRKDPTSRNYSKIAPPWVSDYPESTENFYRPKETDRYKNFYDEANQGTSSISSKVDQRMRDSDQTDALRYFDEVDRSIRNNIDMDAVLSHLTTVIIVTGKRGNLGPLDTDFVSKIEKIAEHALKGEVKGKVPNLICKVSSLINDTERAIAKYDEENPPGSLHECHDDHITNMRSRLADAIRSLKYEPDITLENLISDIAHSNSRISTLTHRIQFNGELNGLEEHVIQNLELIVLSSLCDGNGDSVKQTIDQLSEHLENFRIRLKQVDNHNAQASHGGGLAQTLSEFFDNRINALKKRLGFMKNAIPETSPEVACALSGDLSEKPNGTHNIAATPVSMPAFANTAGKTKKSKHKVKSHVEKDWALKGRVVVRAVAKPNPLLHASSHPQAQIERADARRANKSHNLSLGIPHTRKHQAVSNSLFGSQSLRYAAPVTSCTPVVRTQNASWFHGLQGDKLPSWMDDYMVLHQDESWRDKPQIDIIEKDVSFYASRRTSTQHKYCRGKVIATRNELNMQVDQSVTDEQKLLNVALNQLRCGIEAIFDSSDKRGDIAEFNLRMDFSESVLQTVRRKIVQLMRQCDLVADINFELVATDTGKTIDINCVDQPKVNYARADPSPRDDYFLTTHRVTENIHRIRSNNPDESAAYFQARR